MAKGKSKSKGKGEQHGKRGKKGFHAMERHEDKQETQTGQEYTEWTDTSWITLTTGLMQTGDRSTDLWTDLAREQAARQLPSMQPAEEQSNQTQGGSISMLDGLTMCELLFDDGEHQLDQNEVDRKPCDDWNDRAETWVQNEMTNAHKSWKNIIWHRNWIQRVVTTSGTEIGKKMFA